MVVNQIDEAEKRDIKIDINQLSSLLGVKILTTNAKKNIGIDNIKEAVFKKEFSKADTIGFEIPIQQKTIIDKISEKTSEQNLYRIWTLLAAENYLGKINNIREILNQEQLKCEMPKRLQVQETIRRYQNIDEVLGKVLEKKAAFKELLTEKLDKVLVHPFLGMSFLC